jgi:hypothetical protein
MRARRGQPTEDEAQAHQQARKGSISLKVACARTGHPQAISLAPRVLDTDQAKSPDRLPS